MDSRVAISAGRLELILCRVQGARLLPLRSLGGGDGVLLVTGRRALHLQALRHA